MEYYEELLFSIIQILLALALVLIMYTLSTYVMHKLIILPALKYSITYV